jgi:CheY-like chemotaxis protein
MTASKRILIVDDDRDIRLGTHFRLRSAGYETLLEENGQRGIDSAEQHHPDAIVMDIKMPEMDGVTALELLRESPSTCDIPVVIVSASPGEEARALQQGASYFIRKPYSAGALIAAVNAVTECSENADRTVGLVSRRNHRKSAEGRSTAHAR